MLRALLFLTGCGLIVAGVWWVIPWLALIVGGVLVCCLAYLLELSAVRGEATTRAGGQ